MSELLKIFLTAGLTIVGGIFVFAIGQILQRFMLDPVQAQKRTVGEIVYAMNFYRNVGGSISPEEDRREARRAVRRLASELRQSLEVIPKYDLLARHGLVLKRPNLIEVSYELIGWSNTFESGSRGDHLDKIAKALGVELNLPRIESTEN